MKPVTYERVMSYLIIGLLAVAALTACGSDSSTLPVYGGVEITCAEAAASSDGVCNAEKVSKPGRSALAYTLVNVPTSIFNSGILNTTDIIYTDIEATNNGIANARVFVFIDGDNISGCIGSSTKTMTFDVNALSTVNMGTTGTGYDLCATPGASSYTVTIYNAAHLPTNYGGGDPLIDEPLHQAIVNFTYKLPD